MANSSIAIARKLFTDTPSKILEKNETQDRVRNLIAELGDNDREILTLRHIEGLTNAEIADLMRTKPNTVRQKYGRALRRLHERLKDHGISLGSLSLRAGVSVSQRSSYDTSMAIRHHPPSGPLGECGHLFWA